MREFITHDNGAFPYTVRIQPGVAMVYTNVYNEAAAKLKSTPDSGWIPNKLILQQTFAKYRTGDSGSSVLLETLDEAGNPEFVYIGDNIVKFSLEPGDTLVKFKGKIGNSDVLYDYVQGKKNTYFLNELKYMPNTLFKTEKGDPETDRYQFFYGHHYSLDDKENRKKHDKLKRSMTKKIISKRGSYAKTSKTSV